MISDVFKTLKSKDRDRLIEKSLLNWFGKKQLGLCSSLADAIKSSKNDERLSEQISAKIRQPVSYGSGIFQSAEDEISRCAVTGDLIDLSLIGDLSASYEIILEGPSLSPIKLDGIMEKQKISKAVICEFWLSYLFPVYVFDTYRKIYNKSTMTWHFEPVKYSKSIVGCSLIKKAEKLIKGNDYIKVSKKFCSIPIDTPYIRSYHGIPRIFDCLFTTTAGGMRLEFDMRGFRTSRIKVGSNWSIKEKKVIKGKAENAVPNIRMSWKERLNQNGKVVNRLISYNYSNGDIVSIDLNNKNRVSSIHINNDIVWKK